MGVWYSSRRGFYMDEEERRAFGLNVANVLMNHPVTIDADPRELAKIVLAGWHHRGLALQLSRKDAENARIAAKSARERERWSDMPKRKAFKVTLRPEGGGVAENGRPLLRVMEVYAKDEAGAREYAVEASFAESQEHGTPMYHVETIEKA